MCCLFCANIHFLFVSSANEDTVSSKDEGRAFKDQHQENEERRPDGSISSTNGHKSVFSGHRKIG